MNFAAVYHRTANQYCYPKDCDHLVIHIRTGYDVDRVFIHEGDPFLAGILGSMNRWTGIRTELVEQKELKHHLLWSITVTPQYKRSKYYFELWSGDEQWFYFEDGFYTEAEMNRPGKILAYFIFPWMNPVDILRTPDWVNRTVWYQIFPDSFCNGDPSINPEHVHPWKCEPITGHAPTYGGDLAGIISRLPHLQRLGVTGLYMTPVFKSRSNHKYDTANYRMVDPCFGTNDLLRELVDQAHERGIRVMLDCVFNHTGTDMMMWQDILKNGPASPYADWYMINKFPVLPDGNTRDGRYYSFAFAERMPKLNTNNPEVRAYLLDTVRFWIETFDVDGLRLDVGNEISHLFIRELRTMVKAMKPDFYLLGEIWHDAAEWLQGDEYDSVMNYPFATVISNFWIYPEWTRKDFEYSINQAYTTYMEQANDVIFNLLDSHDTNRLIDKTGGNRDIFYQQLALLFTLPGSPCIYYGTEIIMEGSYDPDCRRCMPWEAIDRGDYDDRIRELSSLISLRKDHPAARSSRYHFTYELPGDRILEYVKESSDEKIKVILNCESSAVSIPADSISPILYSRGYANGVLVPDGILVHIFSDK